MNFEQPNIQLKKADKITMAVVGAIVIALVAIPVLTWFAAVTALLATIMANTMYFIITAGAVVFGGMWLWENRTALLYKWKASARNLRRAVARENPIGVMDVAIGRFEKKLEDIASHLVQARAARKQQEESMQKLIVKASEADSLAKAAQRAGKNDREIAIHAMQCDRCIASADKIRPMVDKFAEICEKLTQARDVCITSLADMKNQREIFKMEYDTMMAGAKAIKGFKAFFGSNPDLEMLQLSIEQIDEQTAVAEAEIDQFLHDLQPQIDKQNLQRDAAEMKAMDRMRGTAPAISAAPVKQLPEADSTSRTSVLNLPTIVKQGEVVGR